MEPEACQPGEHTFARSRDTNEPVGSCVRCSASVEWAERQFEEAEDDLATLAFADVPERDLPGYFAALDREAVAEAR
jgi:hypothetical protein